MCVYICPSQYLGHIYTEKLFLVYLQFKFHWVCCIFISFAKSGNSAQGRVLSFKKFASPTSPGSQNSLSKASSSLFQVGVLPKQILVADRLDLEALALIKKIKNPHQASLVLWLPFPCCASQRWTQPACHSALRTSAGPFKGTNMCGSLC